MQSILQKQLKIVLYIFYSHLSQQRFVQLRVQLRHRMISNLWYWTHCRATNLYTISRNKQQTMKRRSICTKMKMFILLLFYYWYMIRNHTFSPCLGNFDIYFLKYTGMTKLIKLDESTWANLLDSKGPTLDATRAMLNKSSKAATELHYALNEA